MANGMGAKKKRGPAAKAIKVLCIDLCLGGGSEVDFKEDLKGLLSDYSYMSIALALRRCTVAYCKDNVDRVWQLADEVDMGIRRARGIYERKLLQGHHSMGGDDFRG